MGKAREVSLNTLALSTRTSSSFLDDISDEDKKAQSPPMLWYNSLCGRRSQLLPSIDHM